MDALKQNSLYRAALGKIATGNDRESRMIAQKALNGEWDGDEDPVVRWDHTDIIPAKPKRSEHPEEPRMNNNSWHL